MYVLVKEACLFFVIFDLVLSCGMIVVSPCCRRWHNNLNESLDFFPFFGWLLNKNSARVELIYHWPFFTG